MANLGNVIVYKTYKWELWLSKVLPYWLPFISKRKRVQIKWYWKYRGGRRACAALTNALKNVQCQEPKDWNKIAKDIEDFYFEWEVILPESHKNTNDEQQGVVN